MTSKKQSIKQPEDQPKEQRKDKVYKGGKEPAKVRADAEQTIQRILTAMGMTQNVQLAQFIGCHRGDISRWLQIGVPLDIIEFISDETQTSFEYLRYGTKPKFKADNNTFNDIKTGVLQQLKTGAEIQYLKQLDKGGFDKMAESIAINIVGYLTAKTDSNKNKP